MGPDLDSLVTRLYVTVDDLLIRNPHRAPRRPAVGISPQVSAAEMVTLAVIQVLLRFDTEARLPAHVIGWPARNSLSWDDELWPVDSTPVECGPIPPNHATL